MCCWNPDRGEIQNAYPKLHCFTIEFFEPDKRKDGGEYVFKSGSVEKIVPAERVVVVDGEVFRIDRIVGIEGKLFEGEF